MSTDLRRALRDAVDEPRPRDDRALGGPGGLVSLHARVRRGRRRRAVATSAVGIGAAWAVGVGAATGPFLPDDPATHPTPSQEVPAVPTPAPAVDPSDSALCGTTIAPHDTDVSVSLTLPGDDRGYGELVGRSLGSWVPVWVTGSTAAASRVDHADVVLTRAGTVVAVVDDAALLTAVDEQVREALVERQEGRATGTGDLRACPRTGADERAGAVPPAGDYAVHAVAEDPGGGDPLVSAPTTVTLLPEQPLVTAGTTGVRADFPLDEVPLVGSAVLEAVHRTRAGDVWSVTVPAEGDDALLRAGAALRLPASADSLWVRQTSSDPAGEMTPDQGEASLAASTTWVDLVLPGLAELPRTDGPYAWYGSSSTTLLARSDRYQVEITAQTGPGGAPSLVYRVELLG